MMQKKFEKLPGLSNVSGKYTKKNSLDSYPSAVVGIETKVTNNASSGGLSFLSSRSPKQLTASSEISEASTSHLSTGYQDFKASSIPSSGSVPKMRVADNHFCDAMSRPSSSISSPSWPSSLSNAVSERKPLASKSSVAFEQVVRTSEIVKSSSAGSVSKLACKPTGIILGTPSSPQSKVSPFLMVSSRKEENVHNLSRPEGPSTHFPSGLSPSQTAFCRSGYSCSFDSPQCNTSSTSSEKDRESFRPSIAVRPLNLHYCQKDARHLSMIHPNRGHANSFSGPPWDHHLSLNSSESHSLMSPAGSVRNFIPDRPMQTSRSGSFRYPEAFSTSEQGTHLSYNCENVSSRLHSRFEPDINAMNFQVDPRHSLGFSEVSALHKQSKAASQFERLDRSFPVVSESRCAVSMASQDRLSPLLTTMPGLQYTQHTLEQYLSELLAEEKSFRSNDAASNTTGWSENVHSQCNLDVPGPSGSTAQVVSQSDLDCLRFLEKRIVHALKVLHENANETSLTNSISKSAVPQHFVHEGGGAVEIAPNQNVGMSNRVLEQFTEPELHYLLKAVQDLLVVRGEQQSNTTGIEKSVSSLGLMVNNYENSFADQSHLQLRDDFSRTSCRNNSATRLTNQDQTMPTNATDSDHSSADVMHKQLPLGFQHFKRYLDNKFGPDHPLLLNQATHQTVAERSAPTNTADCGTECHNEDHTQKSKLVAISTTSELAASSYAGPSGAVPQTSFKLQPTTFAGQAVLSHSESNDQAAVGTRFESPSSFSSFQEALFAEPDYEKDYLASRASVHAYPTSSWIPTGNLCGVFGGEAFVPVGVPPSIEHLHRQTRPLPYSPGTHHPSNHRFCYLTPETSDLSQDRIPSYDPLRYNLRNPTSWSHDYCCCRPLENNYSSNCGPYPQQLQSTANPVDMYDQPICGCIPGYHYGLHSPWQRSQCLSASTPPTAPLRWGSSRYASPVIDAHGCSIPVSPVRGQPREGSSGFAYGSPDRTRPGNFQGLSFIGDRSLLASSYESHGSPGLPPRPLHSFSGSVATEPSSYSGSSYCDPNYLAAYHCRMPRSGSAGAGFGCSLESSNMFIGHNHIASNPGLTHPGMVRERSVGPDLSGIQSTCPVAHLHSGRSNRGNFALSPSNHGSLREHSSKPVTRGTSSGSYVLGLRPMSTSLSANDLVGCRTRAHLEMRSTKSSFDLAPELPSDPTLTLMDGSDFYSKIAAFIELDTNLCLTMPNGWSERRSSFGRSYYACDATRQASWHHPTLGAHIPLGWERVDSCRHGVYYQSLLIPHCQRHHPNLWLPAPLKDPNVERESFFSDLRNLQSSLKYTVSESIEVEHYKSCTSESEEQSFVEFFRQLDVETMIEVTRALDHLFYRELHSLVVKYERERLNIVSVMFTLHPVQYPIQPHEEAT